ncbi:hypothetical protein D9M71_728140 [compost metagenome]
MHELAILDVVLGVDGDRLRDVLERCRRLGAHGSGVDAVTAGFFRRQHVVQAVAFDGQCRQIKRVVFGRHLGRYRFGHCR